MRKRAVVLGLIASLVVADASLACPTLSYYQQARLQESFQARLAQADLVVRGRWTPDPPEMQGEGEESGRLEYGSWGKIKVVRARSPGDWIMCTLFSYPTGESDGLFYLDRVAGGEYEIIHFEWSRRR